LTGAAATVVAVALLHHRGRAFFMGFDGDGHVTKNVFVDLRLALEFSNNVAGSFEGEHHIMRLAVLGDLVGQGAKTPGFGLGDLATIFFDDVGSCRRKRINLGLSQILTRKEYVLVKSHNACLSWPIAAVRPMRPALRLSSIPFREAGPLAQSRRKSKSCAQPGMADPSRPAWLTQPQRTLLRVWKGRGSCRSASMTPRQRNRTVDWIAFTLLAIMILNAMWSAGFQ